MNQTKPDHRLNATLFMLIAPVFALAQPATPPDSGSQGSPLAIRRVSVEPKEMAALGQADVTIGFNLTARARAVVRVFDQWRRPVRSIDLGMLDAGDHSTTWNGRDDNGKLCRGTRFVYTIHARDAQRNKAVYDPSEHGAGLEVGTRKFTLDQKTGTLSYVLPRPGWVRIRVGLKDGPLMLTLLDWDAQLAGEHKIPWDGMDVSGSMRLLDRPDLNFNLRAYAMPTNSILVERDIADLSPELASDATPGAAQPSRTKDRIAVAEAFNPLNSHAPRFSVTFPDATTSAAGLPVLAGRTPVRLTIDPKDRHWLVGKRFEVMFYVDGIFIFEEEDGTTPLTYVWDTTVLSPGAHFLTTNVLSYDDRMGVVTLPVIIGDE